MTEDIDVVIVSYNSFNTITKCLDELLTSGRYPVTVIDNASPDGSGDKLRERYPDISVISLDENIGFGRGANVGLKASSSKYSFLVNPDLLLTSNLVETLITKCDALTDMAVLAPAIETYDHTNSGVSSREWVSGAAMIFNNERLKKVGYFDDQIFLFFEETDLCHRIINGGGKIYLDTDTFVEHLAGQSSGSNPAIEYFKWWHYGWSQQYFYKKHGLNKGKKSSARLLFTAFYKYLFALKKDKKLQYKGRFLGGMSFVLGKPIKTSI